MGRFLLCCLLALWCGAAWALGDLSKLNPNVGGEGGEGGRGEHKHGEKAIDRLRVGVTRYVEQAFKAGDKLSCSIFDWRKRWCGRLEQKVADTGWTRDACLNQMALDFLSDNRKRIRGEPGDLDKEEMLKLCVAAEWFFRQCGVIRGWKEYEDGVLKWADWLLERTKPAGRTSPKTEGGK